MNRRNLRGSVRRCLLRIAAVLVIACGFAPNVFAFESSEHCAPSNFGVTLAFEKAIAGAHCE
jgi:hypothetical protein